MHKVVVAVDSFSDQHIELIQQATRGWAYFARIEQGLSEQHYRQALQGATVLIGWPQPHLVADSSIQLLQLASVGYEDYLNLGLGSKAEFRACNLGRVLCLPIAEHIMAMIYCLARGLQQHARDMPERRWQRLPCYPEVTDSTICIVGVGGIGTEVAQRCKGVGMRVLGVGRHPERMPMNLLDGAYAWDNMAEAFAQSDHVMLSFPATSDNANMFDAALFNSFKRGAILYNVGRGSVVNETDLVDALRTGQLGGAGLDVFQHEPLPPEHPLWAMDNVLVTPHSAGRSVREFDRICGLFVDNLQRFRDGRPLLNPIEL